MSVISIAIVKPLRNKAKEGLSSKIVVREDTVTKDSIFIIWNGPDEWFDTEDISSEIFMLPGKRITKKIPLCQ